MKFLCHCHKEAAENLESAEHYLDELTQVANPLAIQAWTQEIEHAEANRLVDPAIMDIYGAHAAPGMTVPENSPVLSDQQPPWKSPKQLWLEMALIIEERQ